MSGRQDMFNGVTKIIYFYFFYFCLVSDCTTGAVSIRQCDNTTMGKGIILDFDCCVLVTSAETFSPRLCKDYEYDIDPSTAFWYKW